MGIVVDLIIVLLIGLCIFTGYKKGLVKCILKLCTAVLALIIAVVLYKPLANFIVNNTTIDENIQLSLERVVRDSMNDDNNENGEVVKEDSGIPKPIATYLNQNVKNAVDEKKEDIIVSTARNATLLIINIASVIIIYIVAKILLKILELITDVVTKLPILKQFNELGGLIYGVLEGIIIVLIIMTIISIITPLTGNYYLANLILKSNIGSFLYNTNIILNLIF